MSTHLSRGEALIEGRYVADIELQEEWIEKRAPVLLSDNRIGYKDLSHAGQAYVQFENVADPEFESRLRLLIDYASATVEQKRAMRGTGNRGAVVDLSVGTRSLNGVQVSPPFFGHTTIEAARFPVNLPD